MKRYNKPTLVVNKYEIENSICANTQSIVQNETVVWIPNGIGNGINTNGKNALKG